MTTKALCRRVAMWQNRLNLNHWELKVAIVDEPDGKENSLASVTRADYYDQAEMQFARTALERPQEEVDVTIVHELVHIHFRDLDDCMWQARRSMGRDLSDAIYHRYDHEVEGVVDRLARVIVSSYQQ